MFISNINTNLGKRINELIFRSKELNFLVGYFFFSGLKEVYESLKQNPDFVMKVLIGLGVDELNDKIYEIATLSNGKNNDEIVNETIQNFVKALNQEDFDTKEFYEQVYFFIDMFSRDRLLIRKTRENNHAKLYIFKLKECELIPQVAILGSSNFTKAGLNTQHELNVEIRDDFTIKQLVNYFDNLWNNSHMLDLNRYKNKIIDLVKTNTHLAEIKPYEAYVLLLDMYNHLYSSDLSEIDVKMFLEKKGYKPFKYQLDAIAQAKKILEDYNGVILADVVGLGKSIIASLIARELKCRGVIIAPPHLIGDEKEKTTGWAKYKEDFELWSWEIFSTGKLNEALSFVQQRPEIKAVIIDEVHRFRNENTLNYSLLNIICRGKKVIMLSATPFNNRPSDIFSYLKLFTIPKKSPLTLDGNLLAMFVGLQRRFDKLSEIIKKVNTKPDDAIAKFAEYYGNIPFELETVRKDLKNIADDIRRVIEPVVIRRNRLDLKQDPEYKQEIDQLPKLHDPEEIFYFLSKKQSLLYDYVVNLFTEDQQANEKFSLCIYMPEEYYTKKQRDIEMQRQKNLAALMRRLLIKRFESSFWAFAKSIDNFINIYQKVKDFIEKTGKYVLNRPLIDKIVEMEDIDEIDKIAEELIAEFKLDGGEVYEAKLLNKHFFDDIENDIYLFNEIKKQLNTTKLLEVDPKILQLKDKLHSILPNKDNKKVVIFSEYKDTVEYLNTQLSQHFKVFAVASKISKTDYNTILANFDASLPKEKQANDYDILIATDKFSEGFNFNRAAYVVNYDIPWNPVRVIQRVGRINRIGQFVFNDLYLYNFFPTEEGASEINLREIAQNKMFMIHKCLGEDAKIFSEDEEPTPSQLYRKLNENPDYIDQTISFSTKIRNLLKDIELNDPHIIARVRSLPSRIKVAKKFDKDQLIVVVKRLNQLYIKSDTCQDNEFLSFEDIFNDVKADSNTPSLELSNTFWQKYEAIKKSISENKPQLSTSTNNNDTITKAQKSIRALLKCNSHLLKPYEDFLKKILDDIINYATLPKNIMVQIADWHFKPDNEKQIKKLIDEIENIKNLLGEDYFEKNSENASKIKNQIIIAIENRKI